MNGDYAALDTTINDWAKDNALKLFNEWAGAPARLCYLSSKQGECFQISIERPKDELVAVRVWAVETKDDMEAHLEWRVSIPELRSALDAAISTVCDCLWRRQPRQ